jgi:hypothetical protein
MRIVYKQVFVIKWFGIGKQNHGWKIPKNGKRCYKNNQWYIDKGTYFFKYK